MLKLIEKKANSSYYSITNKIANLKKTNQICANKANIEISTTNNNSSSNNFKIIEESNNVKEVEKVSVLESCRAVDECINKISETNLKVLLKKYDNFKDQYNFHDLTKIEYGGGNDIKLFFINNINKRDLINQKYCRNSLVFLEGVIFSEYSGNKSRALVAKGGFICLICLFRTKITPIRNAQSK